ncbi:hypothetical protein O3P69_013047 [Scylla paramamosain]|uniref:Transmembrane protein 127 transmembrane region domain-containing protein n=1 Tax=Scylla paramamosain TaxID=85552 RepID=A0AAW0TQZ1_SCYPA
MQAPPSYPSGRALRRRLHCRPSACLDTERNLLSGLVNVAVVVVVCVAVFQPRWFWMDGGGCSTNNLSLYLFFLAGQFVRVNGDASSTTFYSVPDDAPSSSDAPASYIYYINGEELELCVTPHIVSLLEVVIGLVFLMLCAASVQLILDLAGSAGKAARCLRRNALPSIVAVWACVASVGVCYRLTVLLEALQEATKPSHGLSAMDRVQVKFDVGFYLLVLAGGLSVLAVGCSWLRPAHIFQPPDSAPLMEDCGLEGLDSLAGPGSSPGYPCLMDREPPPPLEGNPPPPYSP